MTYSKYGNKSSLKNVVSFRYVGILYYYPHNNGILSMKVAKILISILYLFTKVVFSFGSISITK